MPFQNFSPEDVIPGDTKIMQVGLEGGKAVIAYSRPALEKCANLTAQAATWDSQNPLLTTCTVASTSRAVVLAAPGLTTAPILSNLGFTAGSIQAGSAAAAAHSLVRNIAAGSMIAVGQSAGAGGSSLVLVNRAAQLGGAATTVGSASLAWAKAEL